MFRRAIRCSLCWAFMGMYSVLSILFIILVYRAIGEGPSGSRGSVESKSQPLVSV